MSHISRNRIEKLEKSLGTSNALGPFVIVGPKNPDYYRMSGNQFIKNPKRKLKNSGNEPCMSYWAIRMDGPIVAWC